MIKKGLKRIVSPFGKGSFWVIGLGGALLWLFVFWLAYRISPTIDFNRNTVAGAFLGAFAYSYIAQLIQYKK
jgi:uncharacterized membrane protein YvlD (DUF360 family)